MAIQISTFKCPACGADIEVESSRESAFCTYCGSKVMVKNDNEHVYRNIDEAKIREAENAREIRLKELEIEERNAIPQNTKIIIWLSATAILILLGVIGYAVNNAGLMICTLLGIAVGAAGAKAIFGTGNKVKKERTIGPDEVRINESMVSFYGSNFNHVMLLFKGAGFASVNAIPLNDLSVFTQRKNGQVETVTINGDDSFDEGDIVSKNSSVLITYHSR